MMRYIKYTKLQYTTQWKKHKITLEYGTEKDAQAPVIVSASHATDIPL